VDPEIDFPTCIARDGFVVQKRNQDHEPSLIVAHVVESVTEHELKFFLRLLHRSGITSKSDILFIFPRKTNSFDNAIIEENTSFFKLIHGYSLRKQIILRFRPDPIRDFQQKDKESGEPIWGRKIPEQCATSHGDEHGNVTESTRLSYGSVVSFDVDELDPENSLSGEYGNCGSDVNGNRPRAITQQHKKRETRCRVSTIQPTASRRVHIEEREFDTYPVNRLVDWFAHGLMSSN
ncbi:hypothetical protein HAX54_030408, partial [Datura stramonium]|nr:hypothetical protein [Datura stramonium]